MHDNTATVDDKVCRYYLSGSCMYGDSCRYEHRDLPGTTSKYTGASSSISINAAKEKWHTAKEFVPGGCSDSNRDMCEVAAPKLNNEWCEAAVFVPGRKTHTATLSSESNQEAGPSMCSEDDELSTIMCPYTSEEGGCPYWEECRYMHGELCDMCGCYCLHPTDEEQRKDHHKECLEHHEREMELAFKGKKEAGKIMKLGRFPL